jgi:hypothetical protein
MVAGRCYVRSPLSFYDYGSAKEVWLLWKYIHDPPSEGQTEYSNNSEDLKLKRY